MAAKIFVGGLNWDTTDDGFRSFFSAFGEVEESVVMRDRNTGTSRGFGFVTFKDASSVDAVLNSQDLELDGRKVDCKAAVPKDQINMMGGAPAIAKTKKIFVGGLLPETTEQDMRDYFATYGNVEEANIMMDHHTNRSRGFGFVTFDKEDSVEKVCAVMHHDLGGKTVECKKAVPKQRIVPGGGFGFPGRGGMRGGMRGVTGGMGRGNFGGYGNNYAGGYGGGFGNGYGPVGRGNFGAAGFRGPPTYGGGDPYYAGGPQTPGGEQAYGSFAQAAQPGYPQVQNGQFDAYGTQTSGYDAYGAGAAAYGVGYDTQSAIRSTRTDRSYHPYR